MAKRGSPDEPVASDSSQRKKSKAAAPTVPDDLIEEVLQRLPSRSLARLRCVCRPWNHLISSDRFQERHLETANLRRPSKLVLAPLAKRHANNSWAPCRDCPRIAGARPCRGLVLLCRPCSGYSVLNPSTGSVLHLPPCRRRWDVSCAGIGFHSPTGEYKVVQLAHLTFGTPRNECRVLTVGDPAGWRAPAGEPCPVTRGNFDIEDADPVLAAGRLHWTLVMTNFACKPPQGILSFSLGEESFATVPLPPFAVADVVQLDFQDPYIDHIKPNVSREHGRKELYTLAGTALAELDGRLCMMRDLRRRRDRRGMFEIWKLSDYESGSWSLDYRIGLAPGQMVEPLTKPWLVVPLSYLGGGGMAARKVLLTTTAYEAHVYDPATKTLQTVASVKDECETSCDIPHFFENRLRLVLYQDSLIRIAGMKHEEEKLGFSVLSMDDF